MRALSACRTGAVEAGRGERNHCIYKTCRTCADHFPGERVPAKKKRCIAFLHPMQVLIASITRSGVIPVMQA